MPRVMTEQEVQRMTRDRDLRTLIAAMRDWDDRQLHLTRNGGTVRLFGPVIEHLERFVESGPRYWEDE